ncbi:unnamed protein product [Rotaria sp. Silwood2]|nr:unnamed protein product [Rotaria sp. Silwood2]CAF2744129.1 unnamed protein product [Rotaria sp. Silwood2]CAF3011186.1 unnamed protein product [Rotaria sp. Silwood2]CAF4361980.1 unnamed protein product [Rotaria sp. Silwood2]CAF4366587.1 unnamed protein product [Rotaria sp. Silwood2]
MSTEPKQQSKKTVAPLKNNGDDSKQQQQFHAGSSSATTTAIGKSKFYEFSNIVDLIYLLVPASLSTTAKDFNQKQNLESTILIWYDSNIDKTNDTKETMKELREINNFIVFHIDLKACIDYIESITNEKILLVTSGRGAFEILISVHALKQIDSIFIFCLKPEKYQYLLPTYTKLIGIYTKRHELLNSIKENIILVEKYLETFNFYNQHEQKSTRDLSKESAEFLWFQMFKDVIFRLPRDNLAKQQMIEFCQNYYRGNEKELKFIREFEHDYKSTMAINWYTKQTFLYKIVNKALRTEDIEQLRIFRFFIADLSFNLAIEYEKLKTKGEKILMLYRGLHMEPEELKTLKQNEGSLISTNGFLSTSRSKNVALKFAKKSSKRSDIVPVLYEIECNIQDSDSIIFADIIEFSVYVNESEILFDLGSTFEIISVKEDFRLNLWLIKLRASNKGTNIAKEFVEFNRKEEEETSIELIFGRLLADMGQYDQALKYFQNLLIDDHTKNDDIAKINNLIGTIYYDKGDFKQALQYYELAYNLMMNDKPIRMKDSAKPLTNIGLFYHRKGQYDRAYELYMKSLAIYNIYYGREHIKSTKILINIGNIYTETRKHNHAMQYYQKVLDIQKQYLPSYHIDIAMTLNNIAVVYHKLNDLDRASEYYEQSLNMKQKVLPPDHKDIIVTRNNITKINRRKYYLQFAVNTQPMQKFEVQPALQDAPMKCIITHFYPDNLKERPKLDHIVIRECQLRPPPKSYPELEYLEAGSGGNTNKNFELDYETKDINMSDEDSPELHYTTSLRQQYKNPELEP